MKMHAQDNFAVVPVDDLRAFCCGAVDCGGAAGAVAGDERAADDHGAESEGSFHRIFGRR